MRTICREFTNYPFFLLEEDDEDHEDVDEDSEEELGQPVKRRKPNNEKLDNKSRNQNPISNDMFLVV